MDLHKLSWVASYMPCHDHTVPGPHGPYTETDYWLYLGARTGNMAMMATEIRLP